MPDFEARREKLRRHMKKTGTDALLVTSTTNVTYLTGFTGDDSFLLVTRGDAMLLSDFRFIEQVAEECPGLEVSIRKLGTEMHEAVGQAILSCKVGSVGIEATSMTVDLLERLIQQAAGVQFVPTKHLVEQLREIKDRDEINAIRDAVHIAQRAFAVVRAALRPEQTEKQIAHELENQIRRFGGDRCSFTPIVGVGPRGALPHAVLSDRQIGESDFVLIDWGASASLYVSDLTRVLVTGKIPTKLETIYNIVWRAQQAAIDAIRPGAVMQEVDAAARQVIEDAGYAKRFGHSLGHGIGLQVHEAPRLAAGQQRPLKAGMVVTVEPGIYLPGWGGVRIEDDVLVTRAGHEVLSSVARDFADCVLS